jgi:phosphoribosyl-ATP pyrophosphohydrolase
VNELPAAGKVGKVAVVLDAAGQVRALVRMDAKAFRKSMESGELWVWHDGRVLPLEATRGVAVQVREAAGWYEARLETAASQQGDGQAERPPASPARPGPTAGVLHDLEQLIVERRRTLPEGSYTSYLFREGTPKIRKKLGEEAIEVITATTAAAVATEAADLLYHLLVLLAAEEVSLAQVLEVLAARAR